MSLKPAVRKLAPRTIRAHRILGGPLRGRVIVTSFHDYPAAILGRTEQPLQIVGLVREVEEDPAVQRHRQGQMDSLQSLCLVWQCKVSGQSKSSL